MAGYDIHVDDVAVRWMLARYSPQQVEQRSMAAMNELLAYMRTQVVERTPVGATGLLRGSVFTEVRGRSLPEMWGMVVSPQHYAQYVERGRKPGKMPPRGPIELWAQRVLGDGSLWFVVARAIARRGTQARWMFRDAARKGVDAIGAIWQRHFQP